MSVTINAKGTSTSSFKVGKNGTTVTQGGVISPPAASDLIIDIDQDQSLVIGVGNSGPALITATANQDLHINPAVGGGQYLILNSSRWPTTLGTIGQALTTNGSGILSWTTIAGSGTVSSVAITPSDGIGVTGSPITTSGTFSLSLGNITPDSVAAVGTVTGSNLSGSHAGTSSGSNTGDQTITLTGDVTGSGTGSFAATLTTIGTAVSDSFVKITTDAKGRTYATSAVTSGDITTALGYTPVNKAGDTMTGQLVLNANPGTSLAAATKQYVDAEIAAVASGINVHAACETATSAALATSTYNNGTGGLGATLTCDTNSALGPIGGYAGLNTTSRLLVKNQAATLQNGIYTVTSLGVDGVLPWILTRATDFDGSPTSEVQAGDMTFVQEGTFAGTQWVQIAVGTGSPGDYIIVGTNPIVFSQFSGSGTYTAGAGINITDSVISNTGVTSAVAGANISVSAATGAVTFAVTGTVPSATIATTLATGRTFSLSTDATGTSGSFDGSGNVTIPMTLATINASPQADTFRKITVNGKGLTTATSAVTTADITALVDSEYVNVTGDTMTGNLTMATTGRIISSLIDLQLEAANGYVLKLNTGGTERVRVDNSGNVGIGMTPTYPLDVNGVARVGVTLGTPTVVLGTSSVSTWNTGLVIQNSASLDVSGKVTVAAVSAPRVFNSASTSSTTLGTYAYTTMDSSVAGSVNNIYSSYGNAARTNPSDASTVTNQVVGMFGVASHSNTVPASASTATLVGSWAQSSLNGGTVTNTLAAYYSSMTMNTGASVLNIAAPAAATYDGTVTIGSTSTGTTTLTNLYGLRLRTPTIQNNVTITNRYGISSEDASAKNVFAGSVIVNSTTNSGIGGGADIFAVNGNIGFITQLNASPGSGNSLEIVNRSTGGIKLYTNAGAVVALTVSTAGVLTDLNGKELGLKNIPPNSNTWVRGECNVITGGATVGTSNAGDVYSVYNDSSSSVTLTASGITLRLGGTTTSGNRTLLPYGFATVWFQSSTVAVINGNVT